MRRFFTALGPLFLLGLSVAAHADTISAGTYAISAATTVTEPTSVNPTDIDTLSGTVTIGASGLIAGADIVLSDPTLGNITFSGAPVSVGSADNLVLDYAYFNVSAGTGTSSKGTVWGGQLVLYYLPTLDADGNITLCIEGVTCTSDSHYSYVQMSGPNNPAEYFNGTNPDPLIDAPSNTAVTPEPSSMTLLGTGIVGLAGLARRRFVRA